eukprot:Awhi_evm1s15635
MDELKEFISTTDLETDIEGIQLYLGGVLLDDAQLKDMEELMNQIRAHKPNMISDESLEEQLIIMETFCHLYMAWGRYQHEQTTLENDIMTLCPILTSTGTDSSVYCRPSTTSALVIGTVHIGTVGSACTPEVASSLCVVVRIDSAVVSSLGVAAVAHWCSVFALFLFDTGVVAGGTCGGWFS